MMMSLTSITSFMVGIHLERLYLSSWEWSRRLGLREKKLGWKEKYINENLKKWINQNTETFSFSQPTVMMMGTPSSFQFWIYSGSPSIFTCSISLFKFSSVVPVYKHQTTKKQKRQMDKLAPLPFSQKKFILSLSALISLK